MVMALRYGLIFLMLITMWASALIEKLESDDFYKLFGNPVKCKIFGTDRILMSFDLYERLFGKVNLDKENTIEMGNEQEWSYSKCWTK